MAKYNFRNFIAGAALVLAAVVGATFASNEAKADPTFKNWYLQANAGASLQKQTSNDRDSAVASGVAVGYDFGGWRLESEYLNVYQSENSGGLIGNVKGNFLFVNGYVEPWVWNGFKPFVTAGVGYSWMGGNGVNGNNNGMAYNVGGGVSYNLSPVWKLVGEYRYVTTDHKNTVNNSGNTERFVGNVVNVGLRYTF